MDSLSFDGYTSYSDASTPRTPSPTDMHFHHDYKQDIDQPVRSLFPTDDDNNNAVLVNPQDPHYWPHSQNSNLNFNYNSRGSLLQELYEPEIHDQHSVSPPADTPYQQENWNQQQQQQRPSEFSMMRRATFPYVRHDREDGMPMQQYPPFMQQQQQQLQHHNHLSHHQQQMLHQHQQQQHHDHLVHYSSRQDSLYGEQHGMDGHAESFIPSMSSSPHSSYTDFDAEHHNIKLEDSGAPLMVPSQTAFYRTASSSPGCHPHPLSSMAYLSPHTGLPVQHTDDAASKETQYLRRRCFNCHTTEPPSWRRSTLNPGKIVCNKCGLYERTHLRPRPLRFDELRAGNKARKQSKGGAGAASAAAAGGGGAGVSPKQGKMVKKELREFGSGALVRRSSVSSSSSVHSGSGASDWDDNVSIYSSGSAPPTSFNSPIQNPFPLSRDNSHSPPQRDGGIRLPNNPLSDIASLHLSSSSVPQQGQQSQHTTPRKSHTAPAYYSSSPLLNGSASANGSVSGSVNASPAVGHAQLLAETASVTSSPQAVNATVAVASS
ncbi:hypothetical protein BDZ97DRAFT_1921625 [Flammula alnicola]|nr:hypothetical protein BDZ97DRAFT_1921625 [Flammula alnicola]